MISALTVGIVGVVVAIIIATSGGDDKDNNGEVVNRFIMAI